jgi:hypothetical protein
MRRSCLAAVECSDGRESVWPARRGAVAAGQDHDNIDPLSGDRKGRLSQMRHVAVAMDRFPDKSLKSASQLLARRLLPLLEAQQQRRSIAWH